MDEGAVTVDGVRHPLPDPFFLVATQNPMDQWGTYPLPEGQLDRFTSKVQLGRISEDVERSVVRQQLPGPTVHRLDRVFELDGLRELRRRSRHTHVSDAVLHYAVALTAGTRAHDDVQIGASTRAAIALLRCAQALCLLRGGAHLRPDEVKHLAVPVLAHRLVLREGGADYARRCEVVGQVIDAVPVPLAEA